MTRDIFERLIRERFDILVTHDAPTGTGLRTGSGVLLDPESMTEDNVGGPGVPYIRELIETVEPRYQFGGHWHQFRHTKFNRHGSTDAYILDKCQPDGRHRQCMEVIELPGRSLSV
jgi:Icc-related predicted phosphoesterase